MNIFCKCPTINISKVKLWLVMCNVKNLIWTIFSIFRSFFFAPSDSRFPNSCISAKYCPILTNHTSTEGVFVPLSDYLKMDPYDFFMVLCSRVKCIFVIILRERVKCHWWHLHTNVLLGKKMAVIFVFLPSFFHLFVLFFFLLSKI